MLKELLSFFAFLILSTAAMAQVPPQCQPEGSTSPAENCPSACINCNFDDYMGSTAGFAADGAPSLCGNWSIQNDQWLGFIAGTTTNATFTVTPSNCGAGNGVQIAVYASCTGVPIGCNSGCMGCGTTPTVITAALTEGVNYYLLIDGYSGDQCDFTIDVIPPSAVISGNVGLTGNITGPSTICPGGSASYSIPAVSDAGYYRWSSPTPGVLFNGQPGPIDIPRLENGRNPVITFPSGITGTVTICVLPLNSCDEGTERCKTITIVPIPPKILPKVFICAEDAPYELPWNEIAEQDGNYQYMTTTAAGCDSMVSQIVDILAPITKSVTKYVCKGTCETVCGTEYCETGVYTEVCQSFRGCDSTVTLNYIVLEPIANILGTGVLSCNQTSIVLGSSASPNTPGVSVKVWKNLATGATVGGESLTVTQPGTYILTTTMNANGVQCSSADTIVVTGNTTAPTATVTGGVIGCGSVTATLGVSTNATSPTYSWADPTGMVFSTAANPVVGTGGTYTVTVTSALNGCTVVATGNVVGNTTVPSAVAQSTILTCNSGPAQLTGSSNTTGVTYAWSGPNAYTAVGATPTTTVSGPYVVTVTNPSNGCTSTATTTVAQNIVQPGASSVASGPIGCPNPSITLTANSPTTNVSYNWAGPGGFSAASSTAFASVAGTYTVTITGIQNGCQSTSTVDVTGNTNLPGASATTTILSCNITKDTLFGNSPTTGSSFVWTGTGILPNPNPQIAVIDQTGTFTLTVTGPNGCTSTATALVNGNFGTPNASANGGIITCGAGTVTITGSSSTPNATFAWQGPAGSGFTATGASTPVTQIGNYTLIVTGGNGCTETATAVVVPDANLPNASALGDTINCSVANATISGGSTTPGAVISWTGPGSFTSSNATNAVNTPGTYVLNVFNPANGCNAQALAVVSLDQAAPGASSGDDILTCLSPNITIFGNSPTSNVTWSWTGPTGFTPSTAQNPSVGLPGTYTLVVTNPDNGCTSSATATVAANQNIPQLTTAAATLTCTVQTVTINTTSNLPVTFNWTSSVAFSSTDQNPDVQFPGTYTVTATAANGCSSTASITVNQNIAPPNAVAVGDTIDCNQPVATLAGSSSTPSTTFAWTGPAGFTPSAQQNPTTSFAGAYNLVVTGPNGCKSTVTANIETNTEKPIIQVLMPEVLTCINTSDTLFTSVLTALSSVKTISWSGPGGYASTLEDPINVVSPGTYNVLVTSENGCTSTLAVAVTQNILPPNAVASSGTLDCNNTVLNLQGSSSTTGATFNWTGPAGFTPSPTPQPSTNLGGQYTLTVTGVNGCTASALTTVQVDTIDPGAAITSSGILTCTTTNATLSATTTSGTSFVWTGAGLSNETTTTVSIDVPGPFTVITTGANGCTSQAVFNQTQNVIQPNATASGDTIDCFSGVATLTGNSTTANVTYKWLNDAGTVISTQQSPNTIAVAGNYTLVVTTTANGCTSTAEAIIGQNLDAPVIGLTGTGIFTCDVLTIPLTATISSPAGSTGVWTAPGNVTVPVDSFDAIIPGLYTYTATAPNGCISTQTINFGVNLTPPADVVAIGGTLDCTNTSIQLDGNSSTSNAKFSWTGPGSFTSTEEDPTISAPGTYVLVVTDPINGCTETSSAVVNANPLVPDISVTTDILTCALTTVTLDATSNTTGVTYKWSGPNNFNSILSDPTTSVAGTYTVVVTNPTNGCTAAFPIVVQEDKVAPNISATGGIITCTQSSIVIQGGSTTTGVTYLWTAPDGSTLTQTSPTVSAPGNYILVVTAPNGCKSTATAVVQPDQNIPVVTVTGGELTCAVTSIQLSGSSDKPDVVWKWTGPAPFTSTDQNPTVTVPGTYTLVATRPNGCSGQSQVVVTSDVKTPDVSIATPDRLDCTTTSVQLIASIATPGSYIYTWTTANGSIGSGATSSTPTATQAGTYQVVVQNTDNGCTSTNDVDVEVDPAVPSAVALAARMVSCYGYTDGSVAIGGVTNGTAPYLFSLDGQPFIPATAYGALPPGDHTMRVQDANGCELETTFTVGEPAELLVTLGTDTTINLGDVITLSLNNTVNYPERVESTLLQPTYLDSLFCPTCSGTFTPPYSLEYKVTVVDSNGCRASDVRKIIVDRTRHIYVPNVFNPNSDGSVNSFLPVFGGNDVLKIKSFRIYDRWGESVHEAFNFLPEDLNAAWDGKIKGKIATPAVFAFTLEVVFKDGETEQFTGDVTIIRAD